MENAYLLITDLHDTDSPVPNRYDYQEEINIVKVKIIETAVKYVKMGYNVNPIFLGDLINRSYKDVMASQEINNFVVGLSQNFGTCYSVVGNHETSFYKNNPFWGMVKSVDSDRLALLDRRVWQPRGLINIINIPDVITDGEVNIYFNHYGTGVIKPEPNKTNIGLFHSDLLFKGITQYVREVEGVDVWEGSVTYMDETSMMDGYNYAFFGHFHDIYGQWDWENDHTGFKTRLYYLASLGRPKHTEVRDDFLERNLPVILVSDGKLKGIEDNKFDLPNRQTCVKEEIVAKQVEIRQKKKQKAELLEYYYPTSDQPVENIKQRLREMGEVDYQFFETLTRPANEIEGEILTRYSKIRREFYGK